MSKVLLVEPYKVLRQAFGLSLFPEHEVQIEESISSERLASLDDYDLLIIDAAALRERDQLSSDMVQNIEASKTAVLWLEDDEAAQPPKRDKLVMIRKPIERKTFLSALSDLLASETASKPGAPTATAGEGQRTAATKPDEESEQTTFQFIDLVDVVEGEPGTKQEKSSARKPKKPK